MDEYTTEFYQLLARNEVQETEDQLTARYIGGLKFQIQETVNMFDPISVSSAHQRALAVEKQSRRCNTQQFTNPFSTSRTTAGGSSAPRVGPTTDHKMPTPSFNRGATGGLKCFACGEPGHRQADCKKNGKRVLFTGDDDEDVELRNNPVYDEEEQEYAEELVEGDVGLNLVVRRSCLTPRAPEDDWLRNNIFQSTCTVLGKVCRFVIDAGSCENIVSEDAVKKLSVKTEQHPRPYKLAWLKRGGEVTVSKRALISFSVGTKYRDEVWCDVVNMDACHLLLGRPWQFDRKVTHDGRANSYSFVFDGVKIVLVPGKPSEKIVSSGSAPGGSNTNLLS